MIVARVALKQPLAINGWPHAGDQTAAVGACNGNKRRHTLQAETAPVVAERTGDGSVVIQRDNAAVFAARAVDGQSGGSIHRSLLVQEWEYKPILAYGCVSDGHSGGWG